ncbi:MAG TPA: glycosyltransferase family 4 protein [Candidatus Saccharimonadales bacterium]|jgi:phosphatidylinositol alpha-mannosyltransferase|nr:glycosyltransferase family 4 protein [Candidatus Saccharimonadales bacterium]
MDTLKIGIVFDDSLDKTDGVQQYVLTLGRWLSSQGHEVHYLVGETKRTDIPNVHSLAHNVGVRFNQNRMAMPLPAPKGPIKQLLQDEQFDVLHVQVPYSPALAGRIIKAAGARTAIVGTFHVAPHGKLVGIANSLLGLWVRKGLNRFDVMTATSAPAQQFAKETFHVDSDVVPLPLDLSKFYDAEPFARYQYSKNIVFLGRLVERKGCEYLLKAVERIHRDDSWPEGAKVLICGTGPLEGALRDFAGDHKIDAHVEFAGFISEEDKPRYLACADIVAYPSTGGESFGIVLLEAMASSRGVVLAGNNPGYASVMAPHPESLFDPHNTGEFAEKLLSLLVDTKARSIARAWQREYVRQFDIKTIGPLTLNIYEQALHKRRS